MSLFPVADDAFDRWIAGTAMVLAPPVLVAAVLTRFDADLLYTAQLAAYEDSPARLAWPYGLFALGVVLLVPAALGLARRIAALTDVISVPAAPPPAASAGCMAPLPTAAH